MSSMLSAMRSLMGGCPAITQCLPSPLLLYWGVRGAWRVGRGASTYQGAGVVGMWEAWGAM